MLLHEFQVLVANRLFNDAMHQVQAAAEWWACSQEQARTRGVENFFFQLVNFVFHGGLFQ
jgi:hypothetical protein